MKFVILVLLGAIVAAANAQAANEKNLAVDFLVQNIWNPFVNDVTTGTANLINQSLNNLLGSIGIGKRQTGSVGLDFLVQNIVNPFLEDVTTGTINVVTQSMNNLVNSLLGSIGIGKRQSGWSLGLDFVLQNIVSPFIVDVTTGTANLITESLNGLVNGLLGIGRGVQVVTQFHSLLAAFFEKAKQLALQLVPFLGQAALAHDKYNAFVAQLAQASNQFMNQLQALLAANQVSGHLVIQDLVANKLYKFQAIMSIAAQAVMNHLN